ncbi:hypothetical protein PYV02_09015 [Leifsonia sp. H3M29-4]|uniref:hypothetical protein n=1 Tax=Salinibacterium metalliresistens TaxID=3031321 RepID=UPI0023DB3F64|nr:hypothetical protein [Salinibacterium metalliresistens]MDF1479219.1 hypothetical protein [Salinibacterium metalliresistens]
MSLEEVSIPAALRRVSGWLAHVRLGDSNRLEPGAGHTVWTEVLSALDEIGYDGWLAMECMLSEEATVVLPRVSALLRADSARASTDGRRA